MSSEDIPQPANEAPKTQPPSNTTTDTDTAASAEDAPAAIHPLEHSWTLWASSPGKPGSGWTSNLRRVHTFDTVEEFWRTINAIKPASLLNVKNDCYMFKEGIAPEWEDRANKEGGKWQFAVSKEALPLKFANTLDEVWLQTLLLCVGEHFTESDEINGVILSIRPKEARIALWTRTATNASAQESIGRQWKAAISNNFDGKLEYQPHSETASAGGTFKATATLSL